MVELHRELIAAFGLHRSGHKNAAVVGGNWDILKQVNGGGIQTAQRDDIAGEKI